jgi:hypothetical protein
MFSVVFDVEQTETTLAGLYLLMLPVVFTPEEALCGSSPPTIVRFAFHATHG